MMPMPQQIITRINDLDGRLIMEHQGSLIGASFFVFDAEWNPVVPDFVRADLRTLVLEGADFSFMNLRGADLSDADLYTATFFEADLSGAILQRADLRGADFKLARLVDADLSDANLGINNVGGPTHLQGANLDNALLNRTNMIGALYDEATVFPAGFRPKQVGMKQVTSK
jgi:uncharacterized protein YjbI with pentapeptide repeats